MKINYEEDWVFGKLQCIESCRPSNYVYATINFEEKTCFCMKELEENTTISHPYTCTSKPFKVNIHKHFWMYILDVFAGL